MTHPHIARLTVAAVLTAALLTGCAPASPAEPESLPHLAKTLTALKAENISLGTITVFKTGVDVDGSQNGKNVHFRVFPHAETPTSTDGLVPVAPWSLFDPDTIAAQATELSKQCPDDFIINIEAISTQAVLSTVSCTGAITRTSAALLNGKPLPIFDGFWSPQNWQKLIDEWSIIAPSGTLSDVTITGKEISIWLAPVDQLNGCAQVFSQTLDGVANVHVAYLKVGSATSFSFTHLSGDRLATQSAIVMANYGMTNGSGISYDLNNSQGSLILAVSQGEKSGNGVITP